MLDHAITWNGISSDEFDGLMIKKVPSLDRPRRKRDIYSVPGRNGDIIVAQDAYEDVDVGYQLFLYTERVGEDLTELCVSIADWLYGTDGGYVEFTDSYEPNYVRYAYISDQVDIENHLSQFGTVTIPFRFRPERYLVTGQMWMDCTNKPQTDITFANPTKFAAKPLIYVKGTGTVTLEVNGGTIVVRGNTKGIYLDCDKMDAYDDDGDNANSYVTLMDMWEFPSFQSGANTFRWGDTATEVKVMPRWWTV